MPVARAATPPSRAASIGLEPSATYTTLLGRPRSLDSATTSCGRRVDGLPPSRLAYGSAARRCRSPTDVSPITSVLSMSSDANAAGVSARKRAARPRTGPEAGVPPPVQPPQPHPGWRGWRSRPLERRHSAAFSACVRSSMLAAMAAAVAASLPTRQGDPARGHAGGGEIGHHLGGQAARFPMTNALAGLIRATSASTLAGRPAAGESSTGPGWHGQARGLRARRHVVLVDDHDGRRVPRGGARRPAGGRPAALIAGSRMPPTSAPSLPPW